VLAKSTQSKAKTAAGKEGNDRKYGRYDPFTRTISSVNPMSELVTSSVINTTSQTVKGFLLAALMSVSDAEDGG
jgi:hypothetical protein